MNLKLLLVGLISMLAHFNTFAQPIEWQCDFKGVRSDNVGNVIWAYCFGVGVDQVYVRKRVIIPGGITLQAEIDAAYDDLKSWIKTGTPDLMARPASRALWDDARAVQARAAMDRAIAAEQVAGTVPKPKPWRVAVNPASTSIPPTRPMWDATGTKSVSERAYVGDICNCTTPIIRNSQTLCPLRPFGDLPPTTNVTACERK